MNEVLYPGVVGVIGWRRTEFPSHIFFQAPTAPVGHIERGIGKNEIGLQIFVQIVVEAISLMRAKVGVDTTDSEVHLRQFPSGRV